MIGRAIEQFREAIAAAGLNPPDMIEADGKLRRFASNGIRGDDAGWYIFHEDGVPAGAFGDWRTGIDQTWRADIGRKLTFGEAEALKRKADAARKERQAEGARQRARIAAEAKAIWDAAQPAAADHPYLTRKGIKSHGARLYRGNLVLAGVQCDGALVLRMLNIDADVQGLEFITPAGVKRFLGSWRGAYFGIPSASGGKVTRILLVEGFATGATVAEATGEAVIVAFCADNLRNVALALRSRRSELAVVVCADDDYQTEGNPGITKATEAARAVGGLVAVPDFGDNRPEGATDFNDLHRLHGAEAVNRALANARSPDDESPQPEAPNATAGDPSGDQAAFLRLANLSPVDYDRCRKAEAEALGIRVETLDKEVRKVRGEPEADLAGTAVMFPDFEPWPDPVEGAELLDDIEAVIARYVIIDTAARAAIALWIVFTYLIDVVDTAPILGVTSPDKRCGKTTLLELLLLLVRRVLSSSNISAAALFRSIELWGPTLLIDEGDSFFGQSDELRGLLNSGHKRATAYVIRTVGDDHEPRRFCTWGAKAIAMIGRLSDTVEDRSIGVRMRRKLPGEKVAKLGRADKASFETFRRRCQRWAADNGAMVKQSQPKIPEELHDRAADNWEPLVAIAMAAGGKWPSKAREAALSLSDVVDQSLGVNIELLADIAGAFEAAKTDRMSSEDLVNALCADPTKRWATLNKGRPLSQRQLASRLHTFAVVPGNIRTSGGEVKRGYLLDKLKDSFSRYVPGFQVLHRYKPSPEPTSADFSSATESTCSGSQFDPEAAPDVACSSVADQKPENGACDASEVL